MITCSLRSNQTASASTAVPEIDRITIVSDIPKTSVSKIDKKVRRERNPRHDLGCVAICRYQDQLLQLLHYVGL